MQTSTDLRGSLAEFVQRFDEWVEDFYREDHPPRSSDAFLEGPCIHFHQAAISHLKKQSSPFTEWLPDDRYFHELLYAMLTAWGMNRGKAKLKDFSDFQESIRCLASLQSLEQCRALQLEELTEKHRPLVTELFECLSDPDRAKVMTSGPFVVGGSKLLHHLLPGLIPPIDNYYTHDGLLAYLVDENRVAGSLESVDTVWQILLFFSKAVRQIGAAHISKRWLHEKYAMNTSIPKVLDNAIISYSWHLWPKVG